MDAHTALDIALTIAGFLSALWIKSMRDDVKSVRDEIRSVRDEIREAIKTIVDHGERIAVLESKVNDLKGGK